MNIFTKIIADALSLPERGVENTLELLEENCTIPFISRYRKERTGGLDEVQVSDIALMREKLMDIEKRKQTIIATIEDLGKMTDELRRRIDQCWNMSELETSICLTSPNDARRRTSLVSRDWNRWHNLSSCSARTTRRVRRNASSRVT